MIPDSNRNEISARIEKILLFLSNGVTPEVSLDQFRRTPLFNLLLLLGMFFFATFSLITVCYGDYFYGAIKLSVTVFLLIIYLNTRKRGIPKIASPLIVSLFYLYFIFIGITGGPSGNDYVWIYTFPPIAAFLSGPRKGTLWSLSLITIIIAGTNFFPDIPLVKSYSAIEFAQISGAYLLIVILSAATDAILLYSFIKMQEITASHEATIRELNASREELHQQAIHDGLTGVFNRRYFNQTITSWTIQAQRHDSATALLMIDVDYFKKYNDLYGHLKGDETLKSVADSIQSSLRRESDMVFRYGGEEFTVLLTKTTTEMTRKITESILHSIRRCNIPHPDSQLGTVSISVGVAEWEPQRETLFAEDFIGIADSALYEAKAAGRACIIYRKCDLTTDNKRKTTAFASVN